MTPERELWACALHVEHEHGDRATAFIADRIEMLSRTGDTLGADRWRAISDCFERLSNKSAVT